MNDSATPDVVTPVRVTVTVDTAELREWADKHADAGHHGIAHILYQAANEGDTLTDQAIREAKADGWDEGVHATEQFYKRNVLGTPGLDPVKAPLNPHRNGASDA